MSDVPRPASREAIALQIREFVQVQFPASRQIALNDDHALLESGIVDSLGILEIVQFIAATFGISIEDDDLQPENFNSIAALAQFVARRRG